MRHHPHHKPLLYLLMLGTLASSAGAQEVPPPVPAKPPEAPARPPQVVPVYSLLFTPEEIRQIDGAMSIFTRRTAGAGSTDASEDFLRKLASGAPTDQQQNAAGERFFTYPQFFLESLAYHTPQNWLVRVNGQKFTPATPQQGNIEVVQVDPDKVVMQWKPINMAKVKEVVEQAPDKKIEGVDTVRGLVVFTLRPNQTFSSYVMRVLEGKVKPVIVDTNPAAAADAAAPAAPTGAPAPVDAAAGAPSTPTPQEKETKP